MARICETGVIGGQIYLKMEFFFDFRFRFMMTEECLLIISTTWVGRNEVFVDSFTKRLFQCPSMQTFPYAIIYQFDSGHLSESKTRQHA